MSQIINENRIESMLADNRSQDPVKVREILAKSLEFGGLDLADVAYLSAVQNEGLLQEIFTTAKKIKDKVYGKRVVFFAPLYVSNLCSNECLYCAFRSTNGALNRRSLTISEIKRETELLINQGHKRVLLVSGESYPQDDFQYILDSVRAIYEVNSERGEIRRVNVNLAPLDIEGFKHLKDAAIGTYQLFQETYHRKTYQTVHVSGKKADYDWRITVFDRALKAGIDDVGLGVLLGLHDWRFEILALLGHANYLQKNYGVGPHTISVPRLEPALGSKIASKPFNPVNDLDFCKLVSILRLAIPYTGIILSTRESLSVRQKTLSLGVSQISAGSRTDPGGYGDYKSIDASQFSLGDHRSLDEVVCDIVKLGYLPSFCTACYRLGRTGEDFMKLAKDCRIKEICSSNAISTFAEYLNDYASPETKAVGEDFIQRELALMQAEERKSTKELLEKLNSGQQDVFI